MKKAVKGKFTIDYDLDEHSFLDFAVSKAQANNMAVTLDTSRAPWIALYRADVVAMAMHFKLTADDLNTD